MVNPIGLRDELRKSKAKSKVKTKVELVPTSITVMVQKTVQAKQFEPVVVSVSQTYALEEGDDPVAVRAELYNSVSKSVGRMMKHELAKWQEE